MNVFEWLLLSHLIGDYLIQTEYEAFHKALGNFLNQALWVHCFKYAACFLPVLWWFHYSSAWLILIFGSHLVFDRRWPIVWWRKNINRCSDASIASTFWLTVVIDQIFEILVLALIVAIVAVSP